MKTKYVLLVAVLPLLVLTACNDADETKETAKGQDTVRKVMEATGRPKFLDAPKSGTHTNNTQP